MAVTPPVLYRTRSGAFRMTCGTNLAGIGKAMLIYANDYEDELPRAGGPGTAWGAMTPAGWKAADRRMAFGVAADGHGGQAGITSCFYLLVKYSEVTPKTFICKGDIGVTVFDPSHRRDTPKGFDLIDAWHFGPPEEAFKHCSYAYHILFGLYALTTSVEPGFAVAADRNPWIDAPSGSAQDFSRFKPDVAPYSGTSEQARQGNAVAHQRDGQYVLFVDSHVEFAKRSYCGVEDDNIYTISRVQNGGDLYGMSNIPVGPACMPMNRKDSVLVHDPPVPAK
jgi:hypothetical protein